MLSTYGFPLLQNFNPVMKKVLSNQIIKKVWEDNITLEHKASTVGGQSGSPILLFENGTWFVIGIHKGGGD